jgi:phosphopantothenate synthetase
VEQQGSATSQGLIVRMRGEDRDTLPGKQSGGKGHAALFFHAGNLHLAVDKRHVF